MKIDKVELIENLERLSFELLQLLEESETVRTDRWIRICSNTPIALFNGVFNFRCGSDQARDELKKHIDYFGQKKLPFTLHLSDASEPKEIDRLLLELGFKPNPKSTAFEIDLETIQLPTSDSSKPKIKRVTNGSELDDYIRVFIEGFSLPPEIATVFKKVLDRSGYDEGAQLQSFVMYEDQVPVAIGSILRNRRSNGKPGFSADMDDRYCTMINLAVSPSYRSKGLGIVMAKELVRMARLYGCTMLGTTGTPEGMHVYRKAHPLVVGQAQRWTMEL